MGDAGPSAADQVHVLIADEIGVGQYGVPGEQAEAVEAFRVRLAMALEDEVVLPVAFRAMGLDVAVMIPGDRAEAFERFVRTARDESGCHHRAHEIALVARQPAHEVDQVHRVVQRLFGRGVAVIVRALGRIVHHHLADQRALAVLQTVARQVLGRRQMGGREIDRRRGAVGEERGHERAVNPVREGEVGISGFERESAGLKPVIERQVQGLAELRPLRRVDVEVDQTGEEILVRAQFKKAAAPAGLRHGLVVTLVSGAGHIGDDAVIADRDQCVFPEPRFRPPRACA